VPVPAALLIQLLDVTAAQVCGISLTPRVNAVTPHLGLKSSLSGVSLLAEVDDAASETTRNPSIGQLDKGSSSSSSSSSSSANTNQSSTDKSTNHQVIPNDAGMSGAADSSAPPPCVPLSVCRHLSPFDPAASAPQHAAATLDCRLGALKAAAGFGARQPRGQTYPTSIASGESSTVHAVEAYSRNAVTLTCVHCLCVLLSCPVAAKCRSFVSIVLEIPACVR